MYLGSYASNDRVGVNLKGVITRICSPPRLYWVSTHCLALGPLLLLFWFTLTVLFLVAAGFQWKSLKNPHYLFNTKQQADKQQQAGDHGGVFSSWRARYFEGRTADPKESEYWTYICQVAEVLFCLSAITVCVYRPLFANKFDNWRWWHQCCVHCQQGACSSKLSHKCDGQLWQNSINYWQPHRLRKEPCEGWCVSDLTQQINSSSSPITRRVMRQVTPWTSRQVTGLTFTDNRAHSHINWQF